MFLKHYHQKFKVFNDMLDNVKKFGFLKNIFLKCFWWIVKYVFNSVWKKQLNLNLILIFIGVKFFYFLENYNNEKI